MKIGASFSHTHLKSLNLDPIQAIKEFKSLGFTWIRLGCYWNEIEKDEGIFNFEELDKLLTFCQKNKIKVVLTVGMKAPRYPEYYIPKWLIQQTKLKKFSRIDDSKKVLLSHVLLFIEKAVTHFKKYKAIKVWQVENEPFDPAGQNWWRINADFLKQEIDLVRKIDSKRKILINLWGNEVSKRKLYKKAVPLADIIGLDIYPRHPIPFFRWLHRYIGPLDSKAKLKMKVDKIGSQGKEVWLAELQAEPWEPGELVTAKENPPSFLPQHFRKNLDYALALEPSVILLWGFEYWLWRKNKGDPRYWDMAKRIINKTQV
jgi:hypothetical protein